VFEGRVATGVYEDEEWAEVLLSDSSQRWPAWISFNPGEQLSVLKDKRVRITVEVLPEPPTDGKTSSEGGKR
jgi:hypothetical protein